MDPKTLAWRILIAAFLVFVFFFIITLWNDNIVVGRDTAKYQVRLETSHKEAASEEKVARNKSNKLLCIILTCSKLIESRGRAVRDTWSKRCDKTIFVSDAFNPSFDVLVPEGSVAGYDNLWATTRAAFQYVHLKFLDDFDWFLKSDDDTYVIVENLKHYLSNFESDEALFFGKHFTTQGHYMAGGPGYVLSREAVKRLIVALNSDNDSLCSTNTDQGGEDVQMGKCLRNMGVPFVNTLDVSSDSERFHNFQLQELLSGRAQSWQWYREISFNPVKRGAACCSPHSISFHQVKPIDMRAMDFLLYHIEVVKSNPE